MLKSKIIEKLENLQTNIREHATYLHDYTYHPYTKIEEFADKLRKIIEEAKDDSDLFG